jgi:hypothetical protein
MNIAAATFARPFRHLKWMTLLLALALGVGSLSLGGCTCADPNGDPITCPGAEY